MNHDVFCSGYKITVGTIFGIGRNYAAHARELNNDVPKEPVVFLKPRSSLCFDGDSIQLPEQSSQVHHEVEVVLLVGKQGRDLVPQQALSVLAGFAVGIDVTARDLQKQAMQLGNPWAIAKGYDTFAPVSEFLPLSESIDLANIEFELLVNGKQRQHGNTKDMIFSCADILSYLSERFTLQPGDLIFTGTPQGVGPLVVGDQVEAKFLQHKARVSVNVTRR